MSLSVLVYYFVLVCSPTYGVDWDYAPTMWDESRYACWTDRGPYFTADDCEEARKLSLWSEWGTSLCYAHAVTLKGDHT